MQCMRLPLVATLCMALLVGCTGSSTTASVTCAQRYWNGFVGACLPEGWRILSEESLRTLELPEETIAAFQYETPHAGQVDTVTITREPLPAVTDTPSYSAANILAVSALPEYALIDQELVTIDGEETTLHVFSARLKANQPVRRYYQLSAASGRIGYTLTGSFPLSVDEQEASEVEFILKNATLREQESKAAE